VGEDPSLDPPYQKAAVVAYVDPRARDQTAAAAAEVFTMWTENIGALTPHLVTQLQSLQAEYSDREVVHAIGLACEREKRSLGYVRGILKRGAFSDTSPPARNGDAASDAAATRAKLDRDRQRTDEYLARLNPRQRTIIDGH
jgi:DnaD/phage-associated family protein